MKKKIVSIMALVVVLEVILPAINIQAASSSQLIDGWNMTLSDVYAGGQFDGETVTYPIQSIDNQVTLRSSNSDKDSYIYGKWKDANTGWGDYTFSLTSSTSNTKNVTDDINSKIIYQNDFFLVYSGYGNIAIKQIEALGDLYKLNDVYKNSSNKIAAYSTMNKIQIAKDYRETQTIKESLSRIDLSWIMRALVSNTWSDKTSMGTQILDNNYYTNTYTVNEYNSSDASMVNLRKFFQKMKTSDELKYLEWWYNTYERGSEGKTLSEISTDETYTPASKLERFLIYCKCGRPLTPKDNADAAKEEEDALVNSSLGATNITSFEDWCRAAVYLHEGYVLADAKYKKDFTDFSNMTKNITDKYKQAQIISILLLPNSKLKETLTNANFTHSSLATKFEGYTGYSDESNVEFSDTLISEALENITSLGEEDYSNWTTRMLTFEDRVSYLSAEAYFNKGIDENVEVFYTEPITSMILHPDLSVINFGQGSLVSGKFKVRDASAYVYLVSTITEVYSMSREVAQDIQTAIDNSTISTQRKYVEGILSIYNGLRLIDSPEAWNLWSRPYDDFDEDGKSDSGNYKSLAEIYDELTALGVFEGLDTSVSFETDYPLGTFMDLGTEELSSLYLKGVAYSATYIPMSTNVYDPYTIANYDEEFLNKFHYCYGFNRKALYYDTNASSAVDLHNTGKKGETKVCTLRTILNCDRDLVLYIDDNFYNVDKLSELLGTSFDRLDNVDAETDTRPWYQKIWSKVVDNFEVDIYEQTKTSEKTRYSSKLRNKVKDQKYSGYMASASVEKPNVYDDNGKVTEVNDNEDQYVFPSSQINDYMSPITEVTSTTAESEEVTTKTYDDYNVLMAYSLVSSVYRDETLFNKANGTDVTAPVFISSPDLACISDTTTYEKSSILNYMLLKNLEANIPVGYNYNIDMDAPLYMDIYGNILTESGYVVVPAACNATLYSDSYYKDIYNVGLFSVYGDSFSLPSDYVGVDEILSDSFEIDEEFSVWKIKSRVIDGEVADYARIATGDKDVADAIQGQFEYNLSPSIHLYNFDKYLGICLEVLRGAPIENINKDFEGLNTNRRVDTAGLVAAAKLEELQKALDNGEANAILAIPNLAFISGLEYAVVFLFKVLVFIVILVMMFTVYIDAVGTQLNLQTFAKCFWVVFLTVVTVVTIPTVFQVTYYQSNRSLLQKETSYISMLNLEKKQSGVEIGVYDVGVPDISTKLLMKLEDINIPWYEVFSKVILSSTFNNLEALFDSYADDVPSALQEDVTVMNDGVYMYTDDLFDSADVDVDLTTNKLYMRTDETLTASFYTPYYVVLESLIERINEYNTDNNWYAYNTKMQKGGKLKTVGMITPYFTSTDFMESEGDILSMSEIHGVEPSLDMSSPFTDSDIEQMQKSLWDSTKLTTNQTYDRVEILSDYAREYISENRDLLGKISDESFLKVMALDIAFKHNKLFGVTTADCYEIYNLSNDDLMRLSIGTRYEVMSNSTLTFSRFVYEVGGTPAVYAGAILCMINWISGYVNPLCTIIVFLAIFVSLFVFKICLRKKSSNLYGYAITTLLLCMCNLLKSMLLKVSMYLPSIGLPPTVCIIIQCVLQIFYMSLLCNVTMTAFKDWRDLAFDRYQHKATVVASYLKPKSLFKHNGDNRYKNNNLSNNKPKNNWKFYDDLIDTHQRRNRR